MSLTGATVIVVFVGGCGGRGGCCCCCYGGRCCWCGGRHRRVMVGATTADGTSRAEPQTACPVSGRWVAGGRSRRFGSRSQTDTGGTVRHFARARARGIYRRGGNELERDNSWCAVCARVPDPSPAVRQRYVSNSSRREGREGRTFLAKPVFPGGGDALMPTPCVRREKDDVFWPFAPATTSASPPRGDDDEWIVPFHLEISALNERQHRSPVTAKNHDGTAYNGGRKLLRANDKRRVGHTNIIRLSYRAEENEFNTTTKKKKKPVIINILRSVYRRLVLFQVIRFSLHDVLYSLPIRNKTVLLIDGWWSGVHRISPNRERKPIG